MPNQTEIPVTILSHNHEYLLIGPCGADRLPALAPLALPIDALNRLSAPGGTFHLWLHAPENVTHQVNLLADLEAVGGKVLGATVPDLLGFFPVANGAAPSRRLWIYTDSAASELPIEAAYSTAIQAGGPLGFLAANTNINISFVRHLSLDPLSSLPVPNKKPLQMIVVFSNPGNLGEVGLNDDQLTLTGCLGAESKQLANALFDLCRLGLIDISFLVGANDSLYEGHIIDAQDGRREFAWRVTAQSNASLAERLTQQLNGPDHPTFHIWHYYGHGTVQAAGPALVTRPGTDLSIPVLGQTVKNWPRLVMLNACDTALPLNAGNGSPALTGIASVALLRGTAALICMLKKVSPDTASATTGLVYRHLARSLFTDPTGIEDALRELRQSVNDTGAPRLDFFCPVLYRRHVVGPLFEYLDRRLAQWQMLQSQSLSLRPRDLWEVSRWSKRLSVRSPALVA